MVGQALTVWEEIQDLLAVMFNELAGSRNGGAYVAFCSVSSAAGRVDMMRAAAKHVFPQDDPLLREIEQFAVDMKKLGDRRNDLAHGIVTKFSATEGVSEFLCVRLDQSHPPLGKRL